MELRAGYKQTEVGVIPEEWEVNSFQQIATLERGKFSARPRNDPKFFGGGVPFIQTGDVTNSNGDIKTYSQTLNGAGLKVSKLFPINTLFFTIAANIGDVGFAGFDTACPDSIVGITTKNRIDRHWLYHELKSRKTSFESLATQNAQLNINLEKLRPYLLPIPPTTEQRAIATALSDVDALLAKIDQLIAKKRDLKQAAMQQLLTGQTRLQGFSGEWEVKRLGDIAAANKGRQLPNSESSESGNYAHLNGGVAPSSYTANANTPGETIAISEGGNSCGFVQFMKEPYWCGGHCYSVIPRGVEMVFLYQALKGRQSEIMGLRVGSGLPNIQKSALLNFVVSLPTDKKEQTAIATVLSDMDTELVALEARRDKTRALKQGMMQALLTGRIRLVGAN
jgi:type I restriction enzyme S subunit